MAGVDGAAGHVPGGHGPAAPGALPAVVDVAPGLAIAEQGHVGRVDGEDGARQEAALEEEHRVPPDALKLVGRQGVAGTFRVDPGLVQNLGPVDVAHAGDDRLLHEQVAHGAGAGADPRPHQRRVRVLAQRVRADLGTLGIVQICENGLAKNVLVGKIALVAGHQVTPDQPEC